MTLEEKLGKEWYEILKDEFHKEYMFKLTEFIAERTKHTTVYPAKENIFNAYKYTPYSKVKVCIVGQDPYIHEGEAHGLAFSTEMGTYTPSLRQIEAAIARDIYGSSQDIICDFTNNLTRWTEQGIMLINIVQTVDARRSNSHRGQGWEVFTKKTVQELDKKEDVIFLLWGKDAQMLEQFIKKSKVLKCEHPVAGSYKGRKWINNDCFNKVDELLGIKIAW